MKLKPHIPAALLLFLLIALAACSARSTPTPVRPSPTAATATSTATATRTLSPTTPPPTPSPTSATPAPGPTPLPVAEGQCPAPEPTPTDIPLPTVETNQACITIEDSLPADLRPGGALLLTDDWQTGSMYHLDLMSWRKSPFPNSRYYSSHYTNPEHNEYTALSPDGKWLAYLEIGYDARGMQKDLKLQVANAEGSFLDMAYWTLNWQFLIGWQDNQHLLLAVLSYPGKIIRLNPFTTQYEYIEVALPDLPPSAVVDYPGRLFGSPDLSHWVYLPDQENAGWRLVNHDGSDLLWGEGTHFYNSNPSWSPNGRYFIVTENYYHTSGQGSIGRLLRVGLDGQIAPLTGPVGNQPVLAWSPDGRYLAGWLRPDPKAIYYDYPNRLALIDVEKPMLIDLCFENLRKGEYSYIDNTPPVWSPDGRYLAIAVSRIEKNPYGYEETFWDTALIDLQTYRGYKLIENYYPWLWMRKPQTETH